jgi:hypothetical protein
LLSASKIAAMSRFLLLMGSSCAPGYGTPHSERGSASHHWPDWTLRRGTSASYLL